MPRPHGTAEIPGIVHRRSAAGVGGTVARLRAAIEEAGATVFADIDQGAAAKEVGLDLRPTRLLVFGSPAAGTPVMVAVPLSALDLPLKILVWQDDRDEVWMTYLAANWLADRYDLPAEMARSLNAPDTLSERAAGG